ncbi:MAG: hypothetical protein ACK5RL_19040 [Acidimicrobiales bacterium]
MLITVSSVRGAPGVTSLALLLASAWPDHGVHRVMVEADCAGGVVGARYQLGVDPGAVALISACGRRTADPDPATVGRPLADGVWAVPGPEVAGPASAAWTAGAAEVAARLAADPGVWIMDTGRLGPTSPTWPLAAFAVARLVVTRARLEDLVQVPERVGMLRALAGEEGPTGVVVMGSTAHPLDDLARFFTTDRVWLVPNPANLATVAFAAATGRGRARRGALWRAVVDLADGLAAALTMPAPTPSARADTNPPPVPFPEPVADEIRWSVSGPAVRPSPGLATGPAAGWGPSA